MKGEIKVLEDENGEKYLGMCIKDLKEEYDKYFGHQIPTPTTQEIEKPVSIKLAHDYFSAQDHAEKHPGVWEEMALWAEKWDMAQSLARQKLKEESPGYIFDEWYGTHARMALKDVPTAYRGMKCYRFIYRKKLKEERVYQSRVMLRTKQQHIPTEAVEESQETS